MHLLPLLLVGFVSPAFAVPAHLTTQGRLLDSEGVPVSTTMEVTFRLIDAEEGGGSLWSEVQAVTFTQGFYTVMLGANEAENVLSDEVLDQAPLWMEVQVEGQPAMYPRTSVASVPYARVAGVAESVAGGAVDASSVSVGGVEVVDESGAWVGAPQAVGWSDLSGIPDDFADQVDDDVLAGVSCSDGSALVYDTAAGWGCGDDFAASLDETAAVVAAAETAIAAVEGDLAALELTCDALDDRLGALESTADSDTLGALACADGEVAKWDEGSAAWMCAADDDSPLTEAEVEAIVADDGYATAAEVEALDSGLATLEASLSALGVWVVAELAALSTDLAAVESDVAALAASAFSGSFLDLADVPIGLDDGDDDALAQLSCTDGELAKWDEGSSAWTCAADNDTPLTEAEVEAMVADDGYATAAALAGVDLRLSAAESDLVDSQVADVAHDAALAVLDSGLATLEASLAALDAWVVAELASLATDLTALTSRLAGVESDVAALAASVFSGSFLDLADVPIGLDDGDDDSLAQLSCGDGELAKWDDAATEWACATDEGLSAAAVTSLLTSTPVDLAAGSTMDGEDIGGVPSGAIVMWSGTVATIPSDWVLCDGSSGTPDLTDRFVMGAGDSYSPGATGGSTSLSTGTESVMRWWGSCSYAAGCVTALTTGGSASLPPYYALAFIMKV